MFLFPTPRRLCAPPLLFSLMASLWLTAPAAYAGTYTAIRTSGTAPATVNPATSANIPTPDDASATAAMSPGSGTGPGGNPTCSASVSPGAFTDAFTWVHGTGQTDATDPAPTCVLVVQNSFAMWYALNQQGGATATGKADPGLTGGTVTPGTYGNSGPSQTKSAMFCSQKSGSSFSVSCSPTASFTGTIAAGALGSVQGVVSVSSIMTSAYPITITPGGTYNPSAGDNRVLTGQRITATLSGIPTNFTVTSYKWSGQSATCFKNYNNLATSNPLVPLGSGDISGPPAGSTPAAGSNTVPGLAFYDSAQENLTLTCAVTLLAPDGKTSVNLTATAPPINVLKPTVSAWGINTGSGPQQGLPSGLQVSGNNVINAYEIWGPITISVPQPFSGGMGCIAQIITADADNATGTTTGGTGVTWVDAVKNASGKLVASQTPALDTGLPFPFGYNLGANGIMNLTNTGSSAFTVPQSGYSGDDPDLPMFLGGGISWSKVFFSSTYNTYVMYQPPGGVWVPLQEMTWSYSITAKPTPGGPYTNPADQSQWGVSPPIFSGGSPSNQNTPPTWVSVEATPLYFGALSQ